MYIFKKYKSVFILIACLAVTSLAFAEGPTTGKGISGIADNLTNTLSGVGKVMVALAYVAGFGFLMFGVLKFKQHKDNPQQVTLGTPIVMTLIGAVLVFIGGFIAPLGESLGVDKTATVKVPGTNDTGGGK